MVKCGVEDISELSRIVIPVNVSGQHWCLAVIDIAQKQVQYYTMTPLMQAARVAEGAA